MRSALVILLEIAELLARYEYVERSTFVRAVAENPDSDSFWETISGLEFWGSSGAVWEVEPFHMSHPDLPDALLDYRRFQRCMIELAELLSHEGLDNLSQRNAALFRRDLEN